LRPRRELAENAVGGEAHGDGAVDLPAALHRIDTMALNCRPLNASGSN
jgi:hypothetical protein